ncbi:MAG: tRNA (guanosine(37)-N1)-methyltransferase TrmD [Rickettsiales bacterium]|nr:tRNA (guanosine(37)-N1)-methyltransferase TrmD [Rickettsiales bacterium]
MIHFSILTLFPDLFPGPLEASLTGKALDNDTWSYSAINIRDFATDKHQTVDDTPYGGGAGMVMKADVISKATQSISNTGRKIYLSPRGKRVDQNLIKELAQETHLTFLCGRYEGVDERVLQAEDFEEVSLGDFVLTGGELALFPILDAIIRLQDGVLGNAETTDEESFENGLLEYPHYTRPASWEGPDGNIYDVPDILKSGNHEKIRQWRHEKSLEVTAERRPDLLKNVKTDQ